MPFAPSLAALLLASTVSATPVDSSSASSAASKARTDGHARGDSHRGRHRHERASHKDPTKVPVTVTKPAKKHNAPLPAVPSLALSMPRAATSPAREADAKSAKEDKPAPEAAVAKAPCLRAPVAVQHGHEALRLSLTKCDGGASPRAVESLGLFASPEGSKHATRPMRIDSHVVERLQLVVDHFDNEGKTPTVVLVAAGRDQAKGHSRARSLDFRIDGVAGDDLLAYCHTLADTVCGYYPGTSTLHLEARDKGEGRIAYVDASGSANTQSLPLLAASIVTAVEPSEKSDKAKERAKDTKESKDAKDAPKGSTKE